MGLANPSLVTKEAVGMVSGSPASFSSVKKAEFLLAQLPELIACDRALNQPMLHKHQSVLTLLRDNISHKQELIVRSVL